MQIDGRRGAGKPKLIWKIMTEKDCREWKLTTVDPKERSTWRSVVRSAMHAANQLPGRGPLIRMMPLNLHVNKKSDYYMMILQKICDQEQLLINIIHISITVNVLKFRTL